MRWKNRVFGLSRGGLILNRNSLIGRQESRISEQISYWAIERISLWPWRRKSLVLSKIKAYTIVCNTITVVD